MYFQINRKDALGILTHPSIYSIISDDKSPKPEDFRIPEGFIPLVCYVSRETPIACTVAHWVNGITLNTHVQIVPEARSESYQAGHAMVTWLWAETDADKLIGAIPEDNRVALLYTLRLGFKLEGFSPASFLRNGKLLGQHLIGLERR